MREVPFPEFPLEEYRRRKEKAKQLLEKYNMDALLVCFRDNLRYYAGAVTSWMMPKTERYTMCALIPREGEPVLIPADAVINTTLKTSWVENVKPWDWSWRAKLYGHPQNFVELFLESVKELKLEDKIIGAELNTKSTGMYMTHMADAVFERVKKDLPEAKFVDATDFIWEQRRIKTPWEQNVMRKVAEIGAKGNKAALEALREGMSERELLAIMLKVHIEEGALDGPNMEDQIVRGGKPRNDMRGAPVSDRPLRRGEQVFTDAGPVYKGYHCDMQRSACIGEPPARMKKLHDLAEAGLAAALDAIKPGARLCDVWQASYDAQRKMGKKEETISTFIGHNIGLAVHEYPLITPESELVLQPGMVMSVEVCGYDVPEWKVLGSYPEEMVLVTEDGYDLLTGLCPRHLWVVK